ncbi:MAG: ribonuclease III [Bryobacterales bacterium]|nr:ribonuclease III [Bryobacterales bacterium]
MGAERVEEALGYSFRDRALLVLALTHSSFAREQSPEIEHNERLEFLGDSVLGLLAAETLERRFPAHAEGRLTKVKASLVNARHLSDAAASINLGSEMRLGRAEERAGGRSKPGLLADALEAVLGAAFLDGGLPAARLIAEKLLLTDVQISQADGGLEQSNAKSALQELLQSHGLALPVYSLIDETGPAHKRTFHVELRLGESFHVQASAATKRAAEQAAARQAVERSEEWLAEANRRS